MRLGDEEITRKSMPSMQAWMLNPSHVEQGIQDVLTMSLGNKMIQNPQANPGQMGMQGTSEIRNDVWEGQQ